MLWLRFSVCSEPVTAPVRPGKTLRAEHGYGEGAEAAAVALRFGPHHRTTWCPMGATQASKSLEVIGAGEGNRTLVVSLGSFCSAIELHPRSAGNDRRTPWRCKRLGWSSAPHKIHRQNPHRARRAVTASRRGGRLRPNGPDGQSGGGPIRSRGDGCDHHRRMGTGQQRRRRMRADACSKPPRLTQQEPPPPERERRSVNMARSSSAHR